MNKLDEFFRTGLNQHLSLCPKSCSTWDYTGSVEAIASKGSAYQLVPSKNTTYFSLVVRYKPPGIATVYEEYLIVDFYGMVGVVGGTLGLFIGFSFFNGITFLIDVIKKMYKKTKNQIISEEMISSNMIRVDENQRCTCDVEQMEYVLNQLKKLDKKIHVMENTQCKQ